MKFTDGNWLVKKGIKIYNATEIVDFKISNDTLTLYVMPFHLKSRGDTLGGPMLTVILSSPYPNVVRLQAYHFKGKNENKPVFIGNDKILSIIEEKEKFIFFKTGDTTAKIKRSGDFSIDFFYNDKYLTRSVGLAYITSEDGKVFMREQLNLDVGENVYGLGERFTSFVKNGQSVDIWNADGGTNSEQTYKNIPFYITNKKYGVLVNDAKLVSYEVGSERVSKVQFSVEGENLDYLLISGASIKDVLKGYTAITGRPSLPPAWSFGLWLTTSFTTNYNEETINEFIDGMAKRDIPLSVFHFDCFWMKEFQWTNFEWDRMQFPDPLGMLKRLKEKGLRVSVWINPYIAQKSVIFDEAVENGYLLKRPNGDVWQWDLWQPGMGIVDFTNPRARRWFSDKLNRLMDMGVDCFKTDFGERIPTDVVYYDGSDPQSMHNYYTYLYNQTVFEAIKEKKAKDTLVFARSATVGSQKFPVHWGGDCFATYESMAESLRGGLSLGLSGFSFWSHDIAGFESTATPDLYKRWVAFGLLSSHSRLHGSNAYKVPWLYGDEAVDVLRFFTKLKCKLMPYIFAKAVESTKNGTPLMRAMLIEFDDPTCLYLDRQYMLGDALLVVPVFSEDGTVTYYLPQGKWLNFLSKEIVEGGRWLTERHDYMSLPLMMRENSVIAVGNIDSRPDYDYSDGITFHLFEIKNGFLSSTVYDINGDAETIIEIKKDGQEMNVNVKNLKNKHKKWDLIIYNEIKSVNGGEQLKDGKYTKIIPDGNDLLIKF